MGEFLNFANKYIENNKSKANNMFRPEYHISPPVGWINDVNGFVYFNDEYHLYAQYYPYNTQWGPVHWGHWKSKDLIKWEWDSVALAPEEKYDNNGNYSGTAIVDNNEIFVMYTGVHSESTIDVTEPSIHTVDEVRKRERVFQEQSIATSQDGKHFIKHTENPVIGKLNLPEGFAVTSFRDPKIFKYKNMYYSLVAAMKESSEEETGYVLIYTSDDRINWNYSGNILENMGSFVECPDYFMLDEHKVLIGNIMDNQIEDIQIAENGYPVIYMLDSNIEDLLEFNYQTKGAIDYGMDFYAPQTMETSDGRRVMIGWLLNFDYETPLHYLNHKWNGAMSLPRELSIVNGKLYQNPIKEVYEYFKLDSQDSIDFKVTKIYQKRLAKQNLLKVKIPKVNDEISIKLLSDKNTTEYFELKFTQHKDEKPIFSVNRDNTKLPLKYHDENNVINNSASCYITEKYEELTLEIFIDNCIVEIFINDGKYVFTSWAFTENEENYINISSKNNNTELDLEILNFDDNKNREG